MNAPIHPPPSLPPSTPHAGPRRRLWLHRDVLGWLDASHSDPQLVKRARLLLWQFFSVGTPPQVKSVRGPGAGWLRSDLGGNHGHQYYLWWAPQGARPLTEAGVALGPNEALLRAVRHHDDTDQALDPGDRDAWTEITARDLAGAYDLPLATSQVEVLRSTARVRLVRGQPGTGKTTVLLEALRGAGHGRALYLTYNPALAARAAGYLREFCPGPGTYQVDDFAALLHALERAVGLDPSLCDAAEAVAPRFREAVLSTGLRLGSWEARPEALYAELHAHFFGHSLPEPFRGAPPCPDPGFSVEAYVALRQGTLGPRAAEVAAQVGRKLLERDEAAALMPGPWRARSLYDRLRQTPTLPEAVLEGVEAVYVDEVQDLTVIEAALLIEVVARRGATLLVVGDEGQTVRPTDFDWGAFAALASRRFEAPPAQLNLSTNLRSPQALALVLRRADALYHTLDKRDRPRGAAADAADDGVCGRVLRCRSDDPAARGRLRAALKGRAATVVIHPDPNAAAAEGVETRDSVKGLDYSTAVLLGAGPYLAALKATASGAEALHAVLARGMIDGLRVCLSRATDTLVFFDDQADGVGLVDALCDDEGEVAEGCPPPIDLESLLDTLSRDEGPPEQTVVSLLDDIRGTHIERPLQALEKARRARSLLGRVGARSGVNDPSLRRDTQRLHGVAALGLGLLPGGDPTPRRALFGEAQRALSAAGCTEAARGVLLLRDVVTRPAEADGDVRDLLVRYDAALAHLLELERPLVQTLRAWAQGRCEGPLPDKVAQVVARVEAVAAVAARFDEPSGVLARDAEALRVRGAEALLGRGESARAIELLGLGEGAPAGLLGRCYEAQRQWAEAARQYAVAGDRAGAVRCHREAGALDAALGLAEGAAPGERATLQWLHLAREVLLAGAEHGPRLTEAERALLREALEPVAPGRPRGRAR